jgi:UDP-glucose 4-epimerase
MNLGVDGYCQVNDSIGWICESLNVKPTMQYSGGDRGWVGDNPFIFLENSFISFLLLSKKFSKYILLIVFILS